jgi:hypothetical protein
LIAVDIGASSQAEKDSTVDATVEFVLKPAAVLTREVWAVLVVVTPPDASRFDKVTPACALALLTIAKAAIAKILNSFIRKLLPKILKINFYPTQLFLGRTRGLSRFRY